MATFTQSGALTWRDFNTDGVSASGKFSPVKGEIRTWAGEAEGFIQANEDAAAANATAIGVLDTDLTAAENAITALQTEVQPVNRGGHGATTAVDGLVNLGLLHPVVDMNLAAINAQNMAKITQTGGSGGTYTLVAPKTATSYFDGQIFRILLNHSGGGSGATLNVDGLGAVAIKKYNYLGTLVDPEAGDLRGGGIQEVVHDGTRFVLQRRVEVSGENIRTHTSTGSGGQSLSWLDFQLTRFNRHGAKLDNLIPTVDGAVFTLQVSSDLGGTWHDTAAYRYSGQDIGGGGNASAHASSSSGTIDLSTAVGNASGEHGLSGTLLIMNAASATLKTSFYFKGQFQDTAGGNHLIHLTGQRLVAGTDNAARIRISSNIASGEVRWNADVI